MLKYLLITLIFTLPIFSVEVNLDKIMTPSEQKETGVQNLSPKEKQALQQWLTSWTINLLNTTQTTDQPQQNNSPYQSNIQTPITVVRVYNGGNKIELSNQSMWTVFPIDIAIASSWLPRDSIEILQGTDLYYPYYLRNTKNSRMIKAQNISGNTTNNEQQEVKNTPPQVTAPKAWTPYGNLTITYIETNGNSISLSDNTTWIIAPNGRFTVRNWHRGDVIKIEKDSQINSSYPFIMQLSTGMGSIRVKPVEETK